MDVSRTCRGASVLDCAWRWASDDQALGGAHVARSRQGASEVGGVALRERALLQHTRKELACVWRRAEGMPTMHAP